MFTVDKIALIRRAYFGDGKAIKEIVRELAVSRKVVRKVVRTGATEFAYTRQVQPRPQLGAFAERLDAMLAENAARPRRERLTLRRTADLLRQEGYTDRRATRAATMPCAGTRGSGSGGRISRPRAGRPSCRSCSRRAMPTSSTGRTSTWCWAG
jgi:hypothetical protein